MDCFRSSNSGASMTARISFRVSVICISTSPATDARCYLNQAFNRNVQRHFAETVPRRYALRMDKQRNSICPPQLHQNLGRGIGVRPERIPIVTLILERTFHEPPDLPFNFLDASFLLRQRHPANLDRLPNRLINVSGTKKSFHSFHGTWIGAGAARRNDFHFKLRHTARVICPRRNNGLSINTPTLLTSSTIICTLRQFVPLPGHSGGPHTADDRRQ